MPLKHEVTKDSKIKTAILDVSYSFKDVRGPIPNTKLDHTQKVRSLFLSLIGNQRSV